MTTYEGWANYHTWNVALWISNDEALYNEARNYSSRYVNVDVATYSTFVAEAMSDIWGDITPDGVSWTDPTLDHAELDDFIRGLAA